MRRNVVLVTGGRAYGDRKIIHGSLDLLHDYKPISLLVQGWARGVDQIAHEWAAKNDVPSTHRQYRLTDEMWKRYGNGAGPVRNRQMFDEQRPDKVLGFHGGNGTADMLNYASKPGVVVLRVTVKGVFV